MNGKNELGHLSLLGALTSEESVCLQGQDQINDFSYILIVMRLILIVNEIIYLEYMLSSKFLYLNSIKQMCL